MVYIYMYSMFICLYMYIRYYKLYNIPVLFPPLILPLPWTYTCTSQLKYQVSSCWPTCPVNLVHVGNDFFFFISDIHPPPSPFGAHRIYLKQSEKCTLQDSWSHPFRGREMSVSLLHEGRRWWIWNDCWKKKQNENKTAIANSVLCVISQRLWHWRPWPDYIHITTLLKAEWTNEIHHTHYWKRMKWR